MSDRTFERVGALSGVGFVVLAALSGFIYPQQPRVDAGPVKTLAWVHDHHTALQAGMIFDFFAAGILLWFVGYLHRVIRRAEGDVESLSPIVLGAGIGIAITTALAALPTVVLAFMDAQAGGLSDLSLVRMLGDLNTIFFSVTSIMTAVFLGALGWAMVRGDLAARWLGWVCLVVAVFNAIRGLDRRHLQQLPRQGLAHHRLGRLRRLPHRHADRQRLDAPPAPRRPRHHPRRRRVLTPPVGVVLEVAPHPGLSGDRSSLWQPPPRLRHRLVPAALHPPAGPDRSAGTTAAMRAR